MNTPLVTIAIPIYNAEKYLENAIQSCINQTYQKWELLLMCDGSTDKSNNIALSMSLKDDRIKVVDDGMNKGLIYRLNQSVQMARGVLYSRMDADDIMYVTRIEEQVKYLQMHPEIDVLGTSIMTIDNENHIVGSGLSSGFVQSFVHPTVMGKTEWFRNNPYSSWAHRAEDFELWSRTSSKSVFYALDKPLLFYREFGVPTLKKTIQSLLTVFKISLRFSQYRKPFSWFIKNSLGSIFKVLIYTILTVFGLSDYIPKLRRRTPLPENKRLTMDNLNKSIQKM